MTSQPVHIFCFFPVHFPSLLASARYNMVFTSGWRPLGSFPSWPRRSNADGLCPQRRTRQIQKGQGRGKKGSGRLNAPKHPSWPSRTGLLPRPEEVSHCWGWSRGSGAQSHPLERPGAADGLCPGISQHSIPVCVPEEPSPAAVAGPDLLFMCFPLAEKTSQAAPERGACLVAAGGAERGGENRGNLTLL